MQTITFDLTSRPAGAERGEAGRFFDLRRHEEPGSDLSPSFEIGGGYCTCSCSNSNTCSNNVAEAASDA